MNMVKKRLNKKLEIYGVVITMYDKRTTLAKQVAEEVENFFGDKVFKTRVPRTVKLSEAPGYGEPITKYDPNGKGADAYRRLSEEVVQRYIHEM
jgi:chromosome partitioning protein